ncbi:MAG: preprotein translocase subunit YajC [Planctomycetota bacterium]|nr:MAG: preprotein translocase subunit YajC [Planctomycetota bacterium]
MDLRFPFHFITASSRRLSTPKDSVMTRLLFPLCLLIATATAALAAEGGGPGSAPAPGEGPGAPQGGGAMLWIWLLPLGLLIVLMLSSSRAQKREARQRQEMMEGVRVGQKVVTIGGIHGEVVRKGEAEVDLKLGEGPVVTFNLTAIASVKGAEV